MPEEVCDLNPQKTCRFTTKLVPKLTPKEECTVVPRETCHLRFSTPVAGKKPLITKWCMDDDNDNLLGLSQNAGAAVNPNEDAESSDSSLGGALVPPAFVASSTGESPATAPPRANSSRQPASNDNGSFLRKGQAGRQRVGGNTVEGQTRPGVRRQGRPSNQLKGKQSTSEQKKPTSKRGKVNSNNKEASNRGDGRPSNAIRQRPEIRPANVGQRKANGEQGSNEQRKPTNLVKGTQNKGRPTKVRPTQQRPSDIVQIKTTNAGQRKPINQGKEQITNGENKRPIKEGQGTPQKAGQGIQNPRRPSYGQGNPDTDFDLNSIQVQEAHPSYGTERPLQGNSRQPSFSVSVGEVRPSPEVGGNQPNSVVNTVASQAPEAYLPPPSPDYASSDDLSFGLPQDNPNYGIDSNQPGVAPNYGESASASGPRPFPGQLTDLSDLPDLQDYYDQLPNSLQSFYDQAKDYYYDDQYDQDLDLAAPVAPDSGYGSPGRRQTRRVDPLRRGWMSYQELLG